MQGMVTDIQRFSLNDGPGIRTTIFLKGCNMKCSWCHNPETLRKGKEIHYYEQNCINCFKCVVACPTKAHKRIGGIHHYYPKLCVQCGKCADICYADAMVMSGTRMTVEEIMKEVLQDKAYYQSSGGGVTISGGEALCQLELTEGIAAACREEGIKTAVETNLSLPYESIGPVLKQMDLVICDLKLFDSQEHEKWTGLGNELVLENIERLNRDGIPFIVRTPLIPGATDHDENIAAIADFLSKMEHMKYYELLNFNPLGDSKYVSLSRENVFEKARPLEEVRIEELCQLAASKGIEVRAE